MKILFAMASPEYLRFYDTTIAELARRGHDVVIAVNTVPDGKPVRPETIERLDSRIVFGGVLPLSVGRWTGLARAVRGTMDFVRYLHPSLAKASGLRARMKRQALPWVLQPLDRIQSVPTAVWAAAMNALAAIDRSLPVPRAVQKYVDACRPDLVLVSPLVDAVSDQVDLVKAAHARGIRVGALVASWDNLTNKGDLRVRPEFVGVWNDTQKREAVEFHRVPADRIVVTGSQVFDRWFGRTPTRGRDAFCRMVGLPSSKPFVLYTGSSIFISRAEVEVPFVRRWIAALRASDDPTVREVAVLVRPHPYNGSAWPAPDFSGLGDVAVWPKGGYNPVDEENRAGFFDSLYHCEAVVGINTSAMIEAAVVGRPVLSIVTPEFAQSQEGTLHFQYLLPENGGFVRVASSFEEHARQLSGVLRDPAAVRAEVGRFVASFVRPHGIDAPSLPILIHAIERHGMSPAPAAMRTSGGTLAVRALLFPMALVTRLFPPEADRRHTLARRTRRVWLTAQRLWERAVKRGVIRPVRAVRRRAARVAPARLLPKLIVVSVAGPAVAGMLLTTVFVVGELAGRAPLAYEPPRNIAEAAGMGLGAEVLRMLREGQNPTRPLPVRADIISSTVAQATALEAAVWSRRVRLVRLFDREGFLHDPATKQHMACVATAIRFEPIVQYLFPEGFHGCDTEQVIRAIQARSQ